MESKEALKKALAELPIKVISIAVLFVVVALLTKMSVINMLIFSLMVSLFLTYQDYKKNKERGVKRAK